MYLQLAVFFCVKFRQNVKNKYKREYSVAIFFFSGKNRQIYGKYLDFVLQHLHSDSDSILKTN
jgi:hypothetical protein